MTRPRPAWVPAMRDGVSASRVAVTPGPWRHVVDFLCQRLPLVHDWPERLAAGQVLDVEGRPVAADAPCRPGAVLWYWRQLPPEPRIPFELEVLHQDEHLVVVDKPHFLPVIPRGRYLQETVLVRLKRMLGLADLVPMHRLDRETAGVLLFTVQPATRHAYQALLSARAVRKDYEAVAPWREGLNFPMTLQHRLQEPEDHRFMQMQVVPGEPNAHTEVELITRLPDCDLVPAASVRHAHALGAASVHRAHYRLHLLTGRKHQLRAQMNAVGLPLQGDRLYPHLLPEPGPDAPPDYRDPLQLLAREIAFTDPLTGAQRCFTSRRKLQAVEKGT
jgi:tRNA pseudouridine32 synthase / 23S rRNA pseudouridine746 synthase